MKNKVKVNLDIIGNEEHVSEVLKMLRYMQYCCGIGHSADFNVSVDGDGAADVKIVIKDWTEEPKEDLLRQIKERMDKSHNIKGFSLD